MSDLELTKKLVNAAGMADKIVLLQKDDKGYFITYAFKDGAPHDNRCLDWYSSYQENAYIRNKWFEGCKTEDEKKDYLASIKKKIDNKVGKMYILSSFTCGFEEHPEKNLERVKAAWDEYHKGEPFVPEDHICKVGCPAKKCLAQGGWLCDGVWTKEEPVKCACWHLGEEFNPDEWVYEVRLHHIKKLFE